MTHVPTGVRPQCGAARRPAVNMISGGVRGARGSGQGDGEVREGDGDAEEEIPDEVLEALFSDVENEDDVAGLFGDFEAEDGPPGDAADEAGPAREQPDAPEEVPPPPNPALPICPSQEDWDEHFRTHINYRTWCPVCVEARGREDPHRRQDPRERSGVAKFCLDYKETRKDATPLIIMRDNMTSSIGIHKCLCKGAADRWAVKRLLRDIENT